MNFTSLFLENELIFNLEQLYLPTYHMNVENLVLPKVSLYIKIFSTKLKKNYFRTKTQTTFDNLIN